jgi:hypothetical protein
VTGLLYFEELDFEDEGFVRADVAACAAGAVGELGRDEETELGTFGHELDAFGPAGDDAVEGELDGLLALVGAVELRATDEGAGVVHKHGIGGLGALAGAGGENLVLEAAGGSDDAFLGGVVLEEFFTFGESNVRRGNGMSEGG